MSNRHQVAKRLQQIASLPLGWDNEGAAPIEQMLIRSIAQLLAEAEVMPTRIVPISSGGVLLEWVMPDLYTQLEIVKPYYAEVMNRSSNGSYTHTELKWEERTV